MAILTAAALLLAGGVAGLALGIEERRRQAPVPGLSRAQSAAAEAPAESGTSDEAPAEGAPAGDSCTVLLPVRNEEHNIVPCLAALLALAGRPPLRVVDDGSEDTTWQRAAAAAAAQPRLTLLPAGPLPERWRGKVHALWAGARGLTSDWLLLTDADVRLHPAALARALAAAAELRLDAVSFTGLQEAHGLGENLLAPGVFALLDALLGDWREAAAGGGPAVANGQFLLLRRAAWESCGGFAEVRDAAVDDVAMAALLRRHGFRTGFFRAPDLVSVRMYLGGRETIAGWRRTLGGLFGRYPGTVAVALAALVAPALALTAALATGRGTVAALIWGAGAAASGWLRAGSGNRPVFALLYPFDALLVAAVLAAGMSDHRRGRLLRWKGREMPLAR